MKSLPFKIIFFIAAFLVIAGFTRRLTKENADRIIPNGMSESNVYELLGTNAIAKPDVLGRKCLIYMFPFFPPPPGVKPKIASLQVIISNGVVVQTIVPQVYQR
jgi:hypothetical protein